MEALLRPDQDVTRWAGVQAQINRSMVRSTARLRCDGSCNLGQAQSQFCVVLVGKEKPWLECLHGPAQQSPPGSQLSLAAGILCWYRAPTARPPGSRECALHGQIEIYQGDQFLMEEMGIIVSTFRYIGIQEEKGLC